MPELPEVEAQRRMLERLCVGRTIDAVVCHEQGGGPRDGLFDDKVIAEGVDADALAKAIRGKMLRAAHRRGKQLWLELCDTPAASSKQPASLLIHLGMTGALVASDGTTEDAPKYKRFAVDTDSWPPRFCKLELKLGGGGQQSSARPISLVYVDSRRFGRILLRGPDPTVAPPISALAPDPLTSMPPLDDFAAMLAKTAVAVKAALLDQGRVVCGVGNWMADEVLYQSKILPAAPCNALGEHQVRALHAAIVSVCAVACDADADSERFPTTWLFHHRWANQTSGSMSSPLGRIHFDTVGGRTSAFIPAVQKGPSAADKLAVRASSAAKPSPAPDASDVLAARRGRKRSAEPSAPKSGSKRSRGAADSVSTAAPAPKKSSGSRTNSTKAAPSAAAQPAAARRPSRRTSATLPSQADAPSSKGIKQAVPQPRARRVPSPRPRLAR